MKKKILCILLLLLSIFSFNSKVNAEELNTVNMYVFYSKTCPHCANELKDLNKLKEKYNNLRVYTYEISLEETKKKLMLIEEYYKINVMSVPWTIIGEKQYSGYQKESYNKYKNIIEYYSHNGYNDEIGELFKNNNFEYINGPTYKIDSTKSLDNYLDEVENQKISIPIIGEINLKNMALPLVTVILGLLDGFNPCAMWILLFLLSLLIPMKNKKRRWTLGLLFLLSSALIYFIFMNAWLNLTSLLLTTNILKILIGSIALIGGIINLRSYIKSRKETGCEIVDNKKRTKLFNKIKDITNEKSFILAAIGIILVACSVNIIELACSAGFPVMYIELLEINALSEIEKILYIGLYIIFFLLDDLIVFFIAMISLELKGFSNKIGKYSKLIGGILMLIIGLLMIIKPEWLMFNF